jgi:hypothetical protein
MITGNKSIDLPNYIIKNGNAIYDALNANPNISKVRVKQNMHHSQKTIMLLYFADYDLGKGNNPLNIQLNIGAFETTEYFVNKKIHLGFVLQEEEGRQKIFTRAWYANQPLNLRSIAADSAVDSELYDILYKETQHVMKHGMLEFLKKVKNEFGM